MPSREDAATRACRASSRRSRGAWPRRRSTAARCCRSRSAALGGGVEGGCRVRLGCRAPSALMSPAGRLRGIACLYPLSRVCDAPGVFCSASLCSIGYSDPGEGRSGGWRHSAREYGGDGWRREVRPEGREPVQASPRSPTRGVGSTRGLKASRAWTTASTLIAATTPSGRPDPSGRGRTTGSPCAGMNVVVMRRSLPRCARWRRRSSRCILPRPRRRRDPYVGSA